VRRGFVSRATAEDVEALVELAAACHSHPWTRAQIAAEVAAGAVLVVRSAPDAGASSAVAASCTYRVVADELELLDVAVAPGWRRRGVGRLLVRLALARGRRAGARVARLEVRTGNAAALALYSRLRFRPSGHRRGYYREPVEDALLMERPLADGDC
jgi:ribosomal-protein-alanine N-acetyltransferase